MAAERRLAKYDSMRDFAKSPEPPGKVAGSADGRNRFLVQRHRARRLHYDLRFEVDGVLVSWAVPRGPNLDPARKSLAVKVEDHPYAYGWFEGIIPSGYGMGDVVLWDDGWWEPDPEYPDEPAAAKAIESGEFKFVLVGRKLRGRFVLIRTSKPGEADDQWLLMKKKDDAAVPGWDPEDYPRSVLSARTNEDIAEGRPGRWRAATADELASPAQAAERQGSGRCPEVDGGVERRRGHPADHQPRQGVDPGTGEVEADHQARDHRLLRNGRAVDDDGARRPPRSTSTGSRTASTAPRAASTTRPCRRTRRCGCAAGRTPGPAPARPASTS